MPDAQSSEPPTTGYESTEPTRVKRQQGMWADIAVLLMHLLALVYLLWVLLFQVPHQVAFLEEFDLPMSNAAMVIVTISQMAQGISFVFVPLAGILFLAIDFYLIRSTTGQRWRPLWLYGAPLGIMLISAGIQFVMYNTLSQQLP